MTASRRRAGLTAGLLTAALAGALVQAPAAQASDGHPFTLRVKVTNVNVSASPADSVVTYAIKPDGTRAGTNCYFVTPQQWTDITVSAPVGYTFVVWSSQGCYNFLALDSVTVSSTTTLFQTELRTRT